MKWTFTCTANRYVIFVNGVKYREVNRGKPAGAHQAKIWARENERDAKAFCDRNNAIEACANGARKM